MADTANEVITLSGVVVVVLVNYLREHQAWGWMRLVQGPSSMKEAPGLVFAKVMGSGHGGGFGLRPSATHQGFRSTTGSHAHLYTATCVCAS